jgi:hypothetical protein
MHFIVEICVEPCCPLDHVQTAVVEPSYSGCRGPPFGSPGSLSDFPIVLPESAFRVDGEPAARLVQGSTWQLT